MHDGTEYPAELKGYDSSTNDLAVLKVDATGLPAASIGSSSALSIGDMVAAIGNPLGELTSTQTVGYISGIGREVATDSLTTISMIQTDAAINPGNSGGPLFNMRGEVIGITTAKYSGTTGSGATIEGIGFAIPIDDVMGVVDDLIDYGYVNSAYMGVSVQNTDESAASMYGMPTGAYIASVDKGGAAERAGIQPKDIVIGLGDYKVSNVTDLTRALRNFSAGDTTTVTVLRGGKELTLEITLDAKPQQTAAPAPQSGSNMPEGNYEDWYDYFRRYFDD
jgi:serine protease Do